MTVPIPLYLIIGVILIAMLSGFARPAVTAALRRDLRSRASGGAGVAAQAHLFHGPARVPRAGPFSPTSTSRGHFPVTTRPTHSFDRSTPR
jgi:hypothetical protein